MDGWFIEVGRDLFDINEDGKFDEQDVRKVEQELGYEGPNRADIASFQSDPSNPARLILVEGIPDGQVTGDADLVAIRRELARRSQAK